LNVSPLLTRGLSQADMAVRSPIFF
jgi:hypothetical protein